MTAHLDTVIRHGTVSVAAVAERRSPFSGLHGLSMVGYKSPMAVLIYSDGVTRTFEIGGTEIAPDRFEQRFPGLRDRFEQLVRRRPAPVR